MLPHAYDGYQDAPGETGDEADSAWDVLADLSLVLHRDANGYAGQIPLSELLLVLVVHVQGGLSAEEAQTPEELRACAGLCPWLGAHWSTRCRDQHRSGSA